MSVNGHRSHAYARFVRELSGGLDPSAEVTARIAAVAAALSAQFGPLTRALRERLSTEIAELGNDEHLIRLLGGSIEGNIENFLHILQYDIDIERVEAPSAAIEYARRLAQNGISVDALLRAYRLGQDSFLKVAYDELTDCPPNQLPAVAKTLTSMTFAYVDRVSQWVVAAYEEERERWLQNRNANRASQIRELLGEHKVDIEAAEAVLGYRLRFQRHLGVIMWVAEADTSATTVSRFERLARELAVSVGCNRSPLFAPSDETMGWAWLPLDHKAPEPASEEISKILASSGEPINIAVGRSAVDVPGFRRTHLQARQAQTVALLSERIAQPVTSYAEIGAVGLLCADLPAAREWVIDILGKLALDDPAHERLRETLRVFLSLGGSHTAAAAELNLHKNSVQYRVRKAEDDLGRPLHSNRSDIQLALDACRRLGGAVLQRAE